MKCSRQSRRNLLAAGVSGLAASVLGGRRLYAAEAARALPRISKGEPAGPMFKTGIAAYSYRQFLEGPGKTGEMTLFDVVDICARLNVDAFEATSYYFPQTSDEFIYKLKRHAFLAGVAISCSPTRDNFCVPKGPQLDKEIKQVKDWVDIAAKLGAPAVRIFAGSEVKGVAREQAFENAVSAMRETSDYAGQRGIFLALEDHHYMTETADDVLKLVNAVNHDWLGINVDTGNFKTNPYAEIEQIAPRAVVCQVKPYIKNPATGKMEEPDFKRLIKIMRDAGYRGVVSLEYEGKDAKKEVPMYIDKLKEAIASH